MNLSSVDRQQDVSSESQLYGSTTPHTHTTHTQGEIYVFIVLHNALFSFVDKITYQYLQFICPIHPLFTTTDLVQGGRGLKPYPGEKKYASINRKCQKGPSWWSQTHDFCCVWTALTSSPLSHHFQRKYISFVLVYVKITLKTWLLISTHLKLLFVAQCHYMTSCTWPVFKPKIALGLFSFLLMGQDAAHEL